MNRRNCLSFLALAVIAQSANAGEASKAIQLHVELDVDPAREKELISNFRKLFKPAISRQPGFVEVNLLKLQSVLAGQTPTNYRLIISFQTEAQRQAWVATADHQRVWPSIEKTLRAAGEASVYDVV